MVISTGPSIRAAVRVINQNSCGSGSICGHHNGGSLVLTNAHVAGTKIGRAVKFDCVVGGETKRVSAKVIQAAYSDKTQTDWAVLFAEDFTAIQPVKLSKKRPTGSHYTHGSPKCIWPQKSTDVTTKDMADGKPLWRWTPNSIGGQSGSGVWSDTDHLQYGLLTWSWGGYGAGQMTAEIYRQALNQTTVGYDRLPDLIEVGNQPHGEIVDVEGEPQVKPGFYSEASIIDLPIWDEGIVSPPPPTDPNERQALLNELFAELDEWQAKWRAKLGVKDEPPGVPPVFGGRGGTFGL